MANTYTPIWKDTYFETTSETINYKIIDLSSDKIIDQKYTKIMPGKTNVSICLNDKLEEYVSPYLDYNDGDFSEITDSIVNNIYAIKNYKITYDNNHRYQKFGFLYDWSYGDLANNTSFIMSEPVNGHLDPRQKLMQTQCEFTGEYKNYANEPLTFSAVTSGKIHFAIVSNDHEMLHTTESFSVVYTVNDGSSSSFTLGGHHPDAPDGWNTRLHYDINVNAGDVVKIWGPIYDNFRWHNPITGIYYYLNITGTAQCKAYGNITSLLIGTDYNGSRYCPGDGVNTPFNSYFRWLFAGYTNLIDVSNLVMTYDGWNCVDFEGCPEPFSGCTGLSYVPTGGDEFTLRTYS